MSTNNFPITESDDLSNNFALKIANLKISFNEKILFDDFSFELNCGEVCTLTGDSGKGKSTILHSILGFFQPENGEIYVGGLKLNENNINQIRNSIAFLPQNLNALPNLPIAQQLELFRSFKHNRNIYLEEDFLKFSSMLNLKEDILKANYSELSGGEKQRVGLIYCLIQNKKIFLLDEPTSALDETNSNIIIDYLITQNRIRDEKEKFTILASSHSSSWLAKSDKILEVK